jgi:hypothetical protein
MQRETIAEHARYPHRDHPACVDSTENPSGAVILACHGLTWPARGRGDLMRYISGTHTSGYPSEKKRVIP